MATTSEIVAADRLVTALDLSALALGGLAYRQAKELPVYTEASLAMIFTRGMRVAIGKLWAPQRSFLQKSLILPDDEPVRVTPLPWINANYEKNVIVEKILRTQNVEHARELGVAVTRAITEQTDETQAVIGRAKGFEFTRHLDGDACEWCHEEVFVYEELQEWNRHANCKCFKVKK